LAASAAPTSAAAAAYRAAAETCSRSASISTQKLATASKDPAGRSE
jgi:hypothetical protein